MEIKKEIIEIKEKIELATKLLEILSNDNAIGVLRETLESYIRDHGAKHPIGDCAIIKHNNYYDAFDTGRDFDAIKYLKENDIQVVDSTKIDYIDFIMIYVPDLKSKWKKLWSKIQSSSLWIGTERSRWELMSGGTGDEKSCQLFLEDLQDFGWNVYVE